MLIAGAVHFVVHLDCDLAGAEPEPASYGLGDGSLADDPLVQPADPTRNRLSFPPTSLRRRFISSIREVVDAEGAQVISNEIYQPGPDRRARPSAPLRATTVRELEEHGYDARVGLFEVNS